MARLDFNTNSVEKRENNYELLPPGWYIAQVSESDIVELGTGNGKALKLTFDILSDQGRGRKVWARLNIQHTSPKTETIAQQQLRELCDSIGIVQMQDTVELHNKPVQIRVKIRKSEDPRYDDSNDIAGFKPVDGAASGGVATPPASVPRPFSAPANTAAAPAAAAPAGSAPPWAKK